MCWWGGYWGATILEVEIHVLPKTMHRVQEIDRQLFVRVQAGYHTAKISPQQFLPKEKAVLEGEVAVQWKEMELVGLEVEILVLLILK